MELNNTGDPRCLYDVLFRAVDDNPYETRDAISEIFLAVMIYSMRLYGNEMTTRDKINAYHVIKNNDPRIQLSFVLMMLVHETSQQYVIMDGAAEAACWDHGGAALCDKTVQRISVFYRVISIGVRSVLETPFTEHNAATILQSFLQFCATAWMTMDVPSMIMHCQFFSGCIESDDDNEAMGDGARHQMSYRNGSDWHRNQIVFSAADIKLDRTPNRYSVNQLYSCEGSVCV